MNGKSDRTDESDVLAQNERLAADLATEKAAVTKLTSDLKTANDSVAAITKERDGLKTENDGLKAKMADFDKEVATALAKRGVSDKAVATPATDKAASGAADLVARYEAVKNDPKQRAEFLKEHGEKLKTLLN
jgi:phage shock protein A